MKKLFVPAVAIALLVTAAACGDDDSAGSATTAAPANTSSAPSTNAAATSSAPSASSSGTDATSASAGPATGEPIKIGFTNVDEGPSGFPGYTKGAQLAVEYVNEQLGGVGGRPLELEVCSQIGDEASAAQCGQKFANDDSLDVIVTGYQFFGGPFYAATSSAGRTAIGTLPLTEADYGANGVWFWSSGAVGQLGAEALYAAENLGAKRIGAVYRDEPAGQAGAELVRGLLANTGAEIVAVPVALGASDYAPAITAAGGDSVDAFLLVVDPTGCIGVANALDQLGIDKPVVGSSSCQGQPVRDATGDKMDGWYYGEAAASPLVGKGVDDDVDTYLAAYDQYADKVGLTSPMQDSNYWAFGQILAIKEMLDQIGADNISPETVDAAIEKFTGPIPLGAKNISCPGKTVPDVCTSDGYILQFQGDKAVDVLGGEPIVVDDHAS